jgi:uncharacterized damage-inducible protein DinB
MTRLHHIQLMAQYNEWMNQKVYTAAGDLAPAALHQNQRAFFGSIIGSLNHILVADLIWLGRFASHPTLFPALAGVRDTVQAAGHQPLALDEMMYRDFSELDQARQNLDALIRRWCEELTEEDLDHPLAYNDTKGVASVRPLGSLLMHFFNHQTHHRGQVTTLLSQAGIDVGVTDLLELIPDSVIAEPEIAESEAQP